MPTKTDWFDWQGTPVRWWDSSPIKRAAYCEAMRCRAVTRRVERDAPRLEVDNDRGKVRIKGKGKKNQWVCQACAVDVPRRPMDNRQETMF